MSIDASVDKLVEWANHPAQMVEELFEVKPDIWQEKALEEFPHSRRLCMKACAGPGKTAVETWLGWNFLLTRPHPVVGATSINKANLNANLWTEFSRWYGKTPLLQKAFEVTSTKIYLREHPETWWLEARTWPKDADPTQIGNALAGLHADYVMWLLDETGDYPEAVMPVCEGIFNGNPIEAHIVQAGNPTRRSGPLYRACKIARDLWVVVEITADPDDPKRTPRVSIDVAREQIKQYGRDNPYVRVRIFGEFPDADFNALIGEDEVRAAFGRYYREFEIGEAPRVMGVDVALYGDDASVIFKRQGIQAFKLQKYRNINSTEGAGIVNREWAAWNADAAFIDATGGFGAGWLDQLRLIGRAPVGVQFSATAHNKARFYNKRAEMYFDAVEWIRRGGALPESNEIMAALTNTTYTTQADRLLLEPKDQVKLKLGYSPDEADAFVLTFAEPVTPVRQGRVRSRHQFEYDPFAERPLASAVGSSYDPFR